MSSPSSSVLVYVPLLRTQLLLINAVSAGLSIGAATVRCYGYRCDVHLPTFIALGVFFIISFVINFITLMVPRRQRDRLPTGPIRLTDGGRKISLPSVGVILSIADFAGAIAFSVLFAVATVFAAEYDSPLVMAWAAFGALIAFVLHLTIGLLGLSTKIAAFLAATPRKVQCPTCHETVAVSRLEGIDSSNSTDTAAINNSHGEAHGAVSDHTNPAVADAATIEEGKLDSKQAGTANYLDANEGGESETDRLIL